MKLPDGTDQDDLRQKTVATKKNPKCTNWGGGNTDYACLSFVLQCNILKLDQAQPSKIALFNGNSKGRVKFLNPVTFSEFLQGVAEHGEPTVVVEFNGMHDGQGGHFAAYESPARYIPEHPLWLKNSLSQRR